MISNKYLVFILLIGLSISILSGQELNQLSIVGKATRATGEIVPGDKLDANKNQAALISFITDLDVDMDFRPWNGAVGKITNPAMGRWNVYVSPGERAIDVHAEGFEPLKVVLSSFGINSVKSGDVFHLKITGNKSITISIIADPNGAEKWLDGELLGTEDTYTISKGEHLLEVKKSGYMDYTKTITVEEEQVLFRDIVLNEIEPVMITMKSVPDGADININNVNEGITNKQLFKFPGKYNLRLSKDKYDQIEEEITVIQEGDNVFDYTLVSNTSVLTINTIPSDCAILINNQELSGKSKEVSAGMYKVEVKKEGYYAETRTVTVIKGKDKTESFELSQKFGKLQFVVEPMEANVTLSKGNNTVQNWKGSKYLRELAIGKYAISANCKGYQNQTKQIEIDVDATTEVSISLQPETAYNNTSSRTGKSLVGMVFVEGGTFQMGSNDGESDEKPVHRVTVSNFYIGRYEVTQELYESVMGKNPAKFKESGKDAPVEQVSWYDAVEYCNKLSDKEGLDRCYSSSGTNIKCDFNANGYRLPTGAEWEYAALGGNKSKGYKYAGGNDLKQVAWYSDTSGSKTHSAGGKQANKLGIYDMSGNVWEWCWDWYGDYDSSKQNNPRGSSLGSDRVNRGGSWNSYARGCRIAYRSYFSPGYSRSRIGFRVASSSK
ncbi:MAG: SUMF1/EgtB/PvdO family nonheme iron enzyme [Candidatus Stygibacter australis]|nr:SUMF1/EgtB/PvdO family nonheme iron enzyme [Candidatus Stygibacter australis]MDP8321331.1 SUMF1/EgtB/PvdO family nonheme iron enzyme [Candidatus Stygibacter australis]